MENQEKVEYMQLKLEGDKLIQARISNGENDILLGTHEGKSIRFSENDVRASGRKTMGVKGIALSSKDDYVVGMLIVKREGTILVATEKGYGKRTEVLQYRTQTRGGKGVLTMRCTDKTGRMVNIMEVVDSDDLIVITDSGVLMRQPVKVQFALLEGLLKVFVLLNLMMVPIFPQ